MSNVHFETSDNKGEGLFTKVLFEGSVSELNTPFKLNDDITNYKFLYILASATYSNKPAAVTTGIISVQDLIDLDAKYQNGFALGADISTALWQLVIKYVSSNELEIKFSRETGTYTNPYVHKVIGIK